MHLSNKFVSLSVAGAIALAFLAAIPSAVSEISAVEQRQASANIALQEWKAAYQALLPVNAVWNKTFTDVSRTRDLVELYRAFRIEEHGFTTDVDTVVQTTSESILVNGEPVGLRRLCIANGMNTLELRASSMRTMRTGLRELAQRSDIEIGDLTLVFDDETSTPVLKVHNLCLRVRQPEAV